MLINGETRQRLQKQACSRWDNFAEDHALSLTQDFCSHLKYIQLAATLLVIAFQRLLHSCIALNAHLPLASFLTWSFITEYQVNIIFLSTIQLTFCTKSYLQFGILTKTLSNITPTVLMNRLHHKFIVWCLNRANYNISTLCLLLSLPLSLCSPQIYTLKITNHNIYWKGLLYYKWLLILSTFP